MRLPRGSRAYEFACHTSACRPPTSGGTGGSSPAGGGKIGPDTPAGFARKALEKFETSRYPQNAWLHSDGSLTKAVEHDEGGGYELNEKRGSTRLVVYPGGEMVLDRQDSSKPFTQEQIDAARQVFAQTRSKSLRLHGPEDHWDNGQDAAEINARDVERTISGYNDAMPTPEKMRASSVVRAVDSPHYKTRTAEEAKAMPQAAAMALVRAKDATGRRILDKGVEIADGQAVGVRANLNVKKSTGVTVQTIHAGTDAQLAKGTGMYSGEAIGYGAAVMLRNVNLSVNQEARAKIKSGESNKFPMASVDGKYTPMDEKWIDYDGVELRFNPMKQHLFVDPDGRPVKSVEDATVVGSSVFARGKITYYTAEDMPKPARDLDTDVRP